MSPVQDDIYAHATIRRLLAEQKHMTADALRTCHGVHGLLLSAPACDTAPPLPHFDHWTTLRLVDGRYGGDVRGSAEEFLPFADDAFEAVVLSHVLEVAPRRAELLGEAVRVLAPGGAMMVFGIHPLSAWTPWFYWKARSKGYSLQWPAGLVHALRQAGLEMERARRIGSAWPSVPAAGAPTGSNVLGGGYVVIGRKRRRHVTPLRVKPNPLRIPSNGGLSPGARRGSVMESSIRYLDNDE